MVVLGFDAAKPDDLELLQAVRRGSSAQVLLLAAHSTEDALVRSLELGADDYLVKPFSFRELTARIRARLRRARMQRTRAPVAPRSPLRAGELVVDLATHTATYAGRAVHLTPTELRLLAYLLAQAGAVVPALALGLGPEQTELDRLLEEGQRFQRVVASLLGRTRLWSGWRRRATPS